jgi:MFS family permease
MGCMIDRFHVTTCILMSSVPAALGVFLFWGFSGSATGLSLLYIFCVVYGFFAGAYTSAWPGVIRLVLSKQQAAEPNMIFGFLALGKTSVGGCNHSILQ